MFKKKTTELVPENPIRAKLENALQQLEGSEKACHAQYQIQLYERDSWSEKIRSAEKFLAHPRCQTPDYVKTMLKMAISSYEESAEAAIQSKSQLDRIFVYKFDIREAITKLNTPDTMSDELKHRLKVIGSTQVNFEGQLQSSHEEDEETIFRSLRGTLLAVEALVELQKESISI